MASRRQWRALIVVSIWLLAAVAALPASAAAAAWLRIVPRAAIQSVWTGAQGIAALGSGGGHVAWLVSRGQRLEAYVVGPSGPVFNAGGVMLDRSGGNVATAVLVSTKLVAIQATDDQCGGHPIECSPPSSHGIVLPLPGVRLDAAPGCDLNRPLAIVGTLLATPSAVCDLASGQSWPLPAGVKGARLAGDVAGLAMSDGSLVVEKWRTGVMLYRIPSAGGVSSYGFVDNRGFDVQSDGTSVFTDPNKSDVTGANIASASPSDPQPHAFFAIPLRDATPPTPPIRLAGGLVAIGEAKNVEIVDLAGREHALIPLVGADPQLDPQPWDFSGDGLARFERPCAEGVVSVVPAGPVPYDSGAPAGACGAPKLAVDRPAIRHGRLRIDDSCPAADTLGCLAATEITVTGRRSGHAVRWRFDGPLLAADPGEHAHVEQRLPAGARVLVACGRAVVIRVVAQAAENADEPPQASTPERTLRVSPRSGGGGCRRGSLPTGPPRMAAHVPR